MTTELGSALTKAEKAFMNGGISLKKLRFVLEQYYSGRTDREPKYPQNQAGRTINALRKYAEVNFDKEALEERDGDYYLRADVAELILGSDALEDLIQRTNTVRERIGLNKRMGFDEGGAKLGKIGPDKILALQYAMGVLVRP